MYKRLLFAAALASPLFLCPLAAFALGACCDISGSTPADAPNTAAEGKSIYLGLTYGYALMEGYREGAKTVSLGEIREKSGYTVLPVEMVMERYTLSGRYCFTPRAAFATTVPYVRNSMTMSLGRGPDLGWEESRMDPVSGLGDIVLRASYALLAPESSGDGTFVLGAGLKTPSGEYREKGSSTNFIHAHMQPGTGSWDPLVFLSYSRGGERLQFEATSAYQHATRNPEGYRFGSVASFNTTGRWSPYERFAVAAGATYYHVGKANDRDGKYSNPASLIDDTDNTGGESLWGSLGAAIRLAGSSHVNLTYQAPLWERVNGTQLDTRFTILAGISATF